MTSREIWERDYRPHLHTFDVKRFSNLSKTRQNLDEAHAAGAWAHYGHLFIWEGMRQSMGDVTMYSSLITDPGWVHDFNRVFTDFHQQYYRYLFEHIGLPDGIWMYEDLGYKNGLFAPRSCWASSSSLLQGDGGLLPRLRPAGRPALCGSKRRRCR